MTQLLAALYRLDQEVELQPIEEPNMPSVSRTLGLRGEYNCNTCTPELKAERGGCPLLDDPKPAQELHCIDATGDDAHDFIDQCPMGIALREPVLRQSVRSYYLIKAAGGPGAYSGRAVGLQPTRVARAYTELEAAENRFLAEIRRNRSDMDRRP